LEIVLSVNNIKRTSCVARHCTKFSSGIKYIHLTNPDPYQTLQFRVGKKPDNTSIDRAGGQYWF